MKAIRRSRALAVLTVAAGLVGLVAAGPAFAHVTVSAPGVVAGDSDAVINFHVPDESASASTVSLKLQLPTDTPIAGVLVLPQQGWTAKITNTKLTTPIKTDDGDITDVVSEIDWTATAGGIAPGFFGQFSIIAGKLPDNTDSLTFKAIQTYSDKTVVSWIEEAAPGSTQEPDHPAPTLHLAASSGTGTGAASSSAPATAGSSAAIGSSAPTVTATAASGSSNGTATTGVVLGIIGIVLGAGALAVMILRGRGRPAA